MILESLLNNSGEWLKGKGPDANIVLSSRIRIARNIKKFIFPCRISSQDRTKVLSSVNYARNKSNFLRNFVVIKMSDISLLDRQFLLERHLISQEHISAPEGKAVLLRKDEISSIMINEEDHLRIQVIKSGFDLQSSWEIANRIDNEFSKNIEFAFSPSLGYLTSCPTNTGTGMRASCMIHLPGLVMTKRINRVLELINKLSFATRGFFGEGTQALGNFFQVSNQVTLGLSETEIIQNLASIIQQLKNQELDARGYMLAKYKLSLEDKIWRALGILKSSRLISSQETLGYLSLLRLGSDLGIISNLEKEVINNLFIVIQPAHLQKIVKKELSYQNRDYTRAKILRERLEKISL